MKAEGLVAAAQTSLSALTKLRLHGTVFAACEQLLSQLLYFAVH